MSLKCLFGFHDWRSTFVGEIPPHDTFVGNVFVIFGGRRFFDNACQRCGKFVGITYSYEAAQPMRERNAD